MRRLFHPEYSRGTYRGTLAALGRLLVGSWPKAAFSVAFVSELYL